MGGEDDGEKVGRTSGKILTTPLLKPEKTTGVLNVLIMCPGWHFQGSADQESFMTKWKLLVASSAKTSDNSANVTQSLPFAIFRRLDVGMFSRVDTWHFQYMETQC